MELDAAYEYINWYLSGWVGGFLMRQGYYSAVPETSKKFMSDDEWGFWFEGKEAQGDRNQPIWRRDGKSRRCARWRFLLRPHGRRGLLERGHGRKPVHGPQMERVHRGLRDLGRRAIPPAIPTRHY